MSVNLYTIGYYICEPVTTPEFLNGLSKQMYSVSACIGEQHPNLLNCYWEGNRKEKLLYQKKLGLNDLEFKKLSDDVNQIFINNQLEVDGMFQNLQDAKYFYNNYFKNIDSVIMGLSLKKNDIEKLSEEMDLFQKESSISNLLKLFQKNDQDNFILGYDILGWDYGSFHTFLCNSLQKQLSNAKFNKYGLLCNTYEEVEAFSREIEGKGEPVVWLPVQMNLCDSSHSQIFSSL